MYESTLDYLRLIAEILFAIAVFFVFLCEAMDAYNVGSLKLHFSSLWNTLDATSISINFACIIIWIYMVWYANNELDLYNVYDVYANRELQWGRLHYKEDELNRLADQFGKVRHPMCEARFESP